MIEDCVFQSPIGNHQSSITQVGRGVLPRSARFPASDTTSLVRPGTAFTLPSNVFEEKEFDR